jgi:hypothetical protein
MASLEGLIGPGALIPPEGTLFWSGAGISVDAPTHGPKGEDLVQRALTHAFMPSVARTVARYYKTLDIVRERPGPPRSSPRLETVLQVVEAVHGEKVLADLLTDLNAKPNPLHRFFADHLSRGGSHVTMNFDTCIERAGREDWSPGALLHVHGELGSLGIGATLARIERGLPSEIRSPLREMLLSPRIRLIVFVGYSGSDFFDVDPFLASLSKDSLAGRDVLWIEHRSGLREVEPRRRQLEALQNAGAQVHEVRTLTRAALEGIGKPWRLAIGENGGEKQPWDPKIPIAKEMKQRASIELFSLMGLHKELARLLDPGDPHGWELLAHTRWAEGRYTEAGAAWATARAGASAAVREERVGAVAWIRGEYQRARNVLVTALEEADGTFEERLALAETLARAYVHMRRSPDSLRLATPRLRAFILDNLPDPKNLDEKGQPLGTHLANRVASARSSLGVETAVTADPVQSFGEYEALNAELNYRQAELRERAARGTATQAEFRSLVRDFSALGAAGDAARAVLLAGPCVYSLPELYRAVRALQITRRQRNRLMAASIAHGVVRRGKKLVGDARFRLLGKRATRGRTKTRLRTGP